VARMQFGGGPEDVYLVPDEDGDLRQGSNVVIRMYSTETGDTPILDLQRLNGQPITYVVTSDGSDGRAGGQIAPFLGPDGIYEMWAGPENQPRFLLQASNLGSVLGTAREELTQHISEINGHSTRLRDLVGVNSASVAAATDAQVLLYDATNSWWEAGTLDLADTAVTGVLWVAASDAPPGFDAAPYQCDGTTDETEINAAANNVFGLPVMLSPGTFNLSANPVSLLGADNVDIEVTKVLRGCGTYATKIVVGSSVAGGIFLGNAVCPIVSDLTIQIGGTSHGIYSTKSATPAADLRSFWHGSIKNVCVIGPWDGTHSGWALRLGSGFRYVVENVEISGVGNGIKVLNEDAGFNCGDAVFIRCFVELKGASGIAYHVSSPVGNANQISFDTCHGIAQAADASSTCWRFDGAGASSHVRAVNCNAEQFTTTVKVDTTAFDIDVDLAHVTLKNGATLADLDGFASRVRCGLAYVEASATATLVDDDNTYTAKPNMIGPVSIYADTSSTVNADFADTLVLRDIVADGPGTIAAGIKRPPAVVHRKTVALTDAATITIDAQQGDDFRVTLGGNRTLAAPINPTDGQHITVLVTQDGTGSRTITWNAVWTFGTITNTLTTTASRRDLFEFVYNSALNKWLVLNASKNLT
jgi:hypothetical protein